MSLRRAMVNLRQRLVPRNSSVLWVERITLSQDTRSQRHTSPPSCLILSPHCYIPECRLVPSTPQKRLRETHIRRAYFESRQHFSAPKSHLYKHEPLILQGCHFKMCLRMVPPFVTAHTFCASRDIGFLKEFTH